MSNIHIPSWVTFPDENWDRIQPSQAGLDVDKFHAFINSLNIRGAEHGGEDHSGNKWGAILTRAGYSLYEWGDVNYRFQTASVGKALSWALIGFAIEDALLDPDQPINETWTGEGELSHPHKYLDQGHHRKLTWKHIIGPKEKSEHYGGFAIEIGSFWSKRKSGVREVSSGVPDWVNWTGDPYYDLYSHAEPGTHGLYSSAGFWRLSQALTSVWNSDLKKIIDERLFSQIGIPPENWDWLTGHQIKNMPDLYPTIPDSYTYLDPPFEINGNPVRSGPGWVIISASDLARFGHLNSTRGIWKDKQIIDTDWLRGHSGGNGSGSSGESKNFTAMGVVTAEGFNHLHATSTKSLLPDSVFTGAINREI